MNIFSRIFRSLQNEVEPSFKIKFQAYYLEWNKDYESSSALLIKHFEEIKKT